VVFVGRWHSLNESYVAEFGPEWGFRYGVLPWDGPGTTFSGLYRVVTTPDDLGRLAGSLAPALRTNTMVRIQVSNPAWRDVIFVAWLSGPNKLNLLIEDRGVDILTREKQPQGPAPDSVNAKVDKPPLTAESVQDAVAQAKTGETKLLSKIEHAVGSGKGIEIPYGLLPVFHSLLQDEGTEIQRLGLVGISHFKERQSQSALIQYVKRVDPGRLEKEWGDDPGREPEYSHLLLNAGLAVQLLGEIGDPSILPLLESLRGVQDLKKLEWAGDIVAAAIEQVQSRMTQSEGSEEEDQRISNKTN